MSSSTATPLNLSCAGCHNSEAVLEHALMRCAGCRNIQYCSRQCQPLDWARHKPQCRAAPSAGNTDTNTAPQQQHSTRTTMRLTGADLMRYSSNASNPDENASAEEPTDTIYYLQTSVPHHHDISLSGPYHNLESLFLQAMHNFGRECPSGQDLLLDLVREDGGFQTFEHITSPINNDPNRTKTVRMIRERNAAMAARLPGPAWYVAVSEVAGGVTGANSFGAVPMKSIKVRGTFGDAAAANEAARRVAGGLAATLHGGRVVERAAEAGGFMGMVVGQEANADGQTTTSVVEARYDSGGVVSQ